MPGCLPVQRYVQIGPVVRVYPTITIPNLVSDWVSVLNQLERQKLQI